VTCNDSAQLFFHATLWCEYIYELTYLGDVKLASSPCMLAEGRWKPRPSLIKREINSYLVDLPSYRL
jgi:hypothetical protein